MKRDPYEQIVSYIVENQEKFYRLAFRYAKNQEDALDIVQNAVCRALDHYRELRNPDAVKTWFYRILVNESLALVKQRNREMPVGDRERKRFLIMKQDLKPETCLKSWMYWNRM